MTTSCYLKIAAHILVPSGAVGFLPKIHYYLVRKFHLMYIIQLALWRQIFCAL